MIGALCGDEIEGRRAQKDLDVDDEVCNLEVE
jgi:hypothetical protein